MGFAEVKLEVEPASTYQGTLIVCEYVGSYRGSPKAVQAIETGSQYVPTGCCKAPRKDD